jgi:hypothetical protein
MLYFNLIFMILGKYNGSIKSIKLKLLRTSIANISILNLLTTLYQLVVQL